MSPVATKHTIVVEVAGPAGVGKSSLAKSLAKADPGITLRAAPNAGQIQFLSFFTRECLKLSPVLLRLDRCSQGHWITRSEFARMALLHGWTSLLLANANAQSETILLDEGPIYHMTQLLYFGSPVFRYPCASTWWRNIYADWARSLDFIVLLDAKEMDMIRRIRDRDKRHSIQQRTDLDSIQYLSLYRSTMQVILLGLTQGQTKPKVLQFNTSNETVEVIASSIRKELCTLP